MFQVLYGEEIKLNIKKPEYNLHYTEPSSLQYLCSEFISFKFYNNTGRLISPNLRFREGKHTPRFHKIINDNVQDAELCPNIEKLQISQFLPTCIY